MNYELSWLPTSINNISHNITDILYLDNNGVTYGNNYEGLIFLSKDSDRYEEIVSRINIFETEIIPGGTSTRITIPDIYCNIYVYDIIGNDLIIGYLLKDTEYNLNIPKSCIYQHEILFETIAHTVLSKINSISGTTNPFLNSY